MSLRLLVMCLACVCNGTLVHAQPVESPDEPPPPNSYNRAQDLRRIGRTWVKPAGRFSWSELIRVQLGDGQLRCEVVPDALRGPLRNNRKVAMEIDGSEAVWEVIAEGTWLDAGRSLASHTFTAKAAFDRGAAPDRWHLKMIRSTPQALLLLSTAELDGQAMEVDLLLQYGQRARLQVVRLENGRRRVVLDRSAADLLALLRGHPSEVRSYVVPALTILCGENPLRPRAADVYAVFSQIEPDSAAIQQVQELLPQLDSLDPRQRTSAGKTLHAMGRWGVLAVMRMDWSELTHEQRARLEHFLAQHRLPGLDLQQAAGDPTFLIDCLADSDPAVRTAAGETLRNILGQDIALDANTPPDHRPARLMSLYRAISDADER